MSLLITQLINFFEPITTWLHLEDYVFFINFNSLLFASLIIFTLFVVGRYSLNYLADEVGVKRFWLLFVFFAIGMLICCFSENLKTFYVGWEIIGFTSFFLIGFYQTNERSIENSLIALSNYKMCDIFFVLAIFLEEAELHTAAGLCLIIATLAKSAQLPFSSWLYRALEGPTPSSTMFYGGLSLHLGVFLLLQFSSMWDHSWLLKCLLGGIGLVSAFFGFMVGTTRSDLKTSFAFASISQVGLIYIELAFGFYHLALWHILGHNLLRTWNYLRGMSFFDDFFKVEFHKENSSLLKTFFSFLPQSLYFHCLNGLYLDQIFLFLRKISLLLFLSLSFIYVWKEQSAHNFAFIYLFLALALAVFIFFKKNLSQSIFFAGLFISQFFILIAIHVFYENFLEHLYLILSLGGLLLLFYSLWPAIIKWNNHKKSNLDEQFLGLANKHSYRHILFLISAIMLSGSPGTLQFFIQENILTELWTKSHIFLLLILICLTLNCVHTFTIGQKAFLGTESI